MIFRRMYIEIQQREFADAWDYWIEKTLNFSIFNDGLAGYKTYVLNGWECDYSLLTRESGAWMTLPWPGDPQLAWNHPDRLALLPPTLGSQAIAWAQGYLVHHLLGTP